MNEQALLAGGRIDGSPDAFEKWLAFVTDPQNLRPGLPKLTVYFGDARFCWIEVTFDSTRASLRSFELELNYVDDDYALSLFTDWLPNLFLHPSLEELRCPFPVTELPDLFHKVPNLRSVNLNDSKLIRLPDSFYRLPNLERLSIYGAAFPELPNGVSKLPALKYLSFSQPCSASALVGFPLLESLSYRVRKSAPGFRFTILDLPSLKELSTNNIDAFENVLDNFPDLKVIS